MSILNWRRPDILAVASSVILLLGACTHSRSAAPVPNHNFSAARHPNSMSSQDNATASNPKHTSSFYTPTPQPPEKSPPESILVELHFDGDYKVIDHRYITDISPINKMAKDAFIYCDGRNIYYKLLPLPQDKYPFYYLVRLQPKKNGRSVGSGKLIRIPIKNIQAIAIPDPIEITITLKNRNIIYHRIDNYSEATIGVYRADLKVVHGKVVAILMSKLFPQEHWEVTYPINDGKHKLLAWRIK